MRKFYLRNGVGDVKPLNGENGIWLAKPTGLGIAVKSTAFDVEDGFFKRSQNSESQANIVGDLMFVRNAYENYKALLDWIMASDKLIFVYQPYGNDQYYRDVEINSITKGELSEGRWLKAPMSLACKTPWYLPVPTIISLVRQQADAMRYPFTYNSDLHYGTSAIGDYAADITANGQIPAGIKLEYNGAVTNPTITLVSADGKNYGEIVLTVTLSSSDKLQISSVPTDCYIRKISSSNVVTDLIASGAVDLTKEIYPRPPANVQSTLTMSSETSFSGDATLEVDYYFRSV